MNSVSKTVSGFRSALQDLIVPELKALKVEIRGVRETLERHEKKLESHDQMFLKLTRVMHERFDATQKQMDDRFDAMQTQMDERFAAMQTQMDERFTAMQQRMDDRFDAMQKQMDTRFEAMRQDNNQKFAAIDDKFVSVMDAIQELQQNTAIIINRLDYTERIHKLELQMARLADKSEEKVAERI